LTGKIISEIICDVVSAQLNRTLLVVFCLHTTSAVPLLDNNLQSDRFWARSTACFSPWQPVGVEVVFQCPYPGHLHLRKWSLPLHGSKNVKICLTFVLSSISTDTVEMYFRSGRQTL